MATYKPLQSVVLTAATSSVTFSGIDQGYTDLVVVCNVSTSSNSNLYLRYNDDATSNYSNTVFNGNGTSATSARNTANTKGFIDSEAYAQNNFNYNATIYIMNYANTTTKKTTLTRANNSAIGVTANVLLYGGTSAISKIDIFANAGNLQTGSTFSLYGIKSGAPQALGGDIVATDGTYWYHAFTSTGTFTPLKTLTADYLVVAGGGGGNNGDRFAGAGGAGGLRATTSQTLTATNYSVTVGAGGAVSTNGSNSVFSSTTSTGGGTGGLGAVGATGGSGGGGALGYAGGSGNTPSTSPSQGNNGGAGNSSSNRTSGGGGGAGAVGGNASNSYGGAGGAGTDTYNSINFSTWLTATGTGSSSKLAGGGGGSAYEYNDGVVDAGAGGAGGGGKGARYGQYNGATTNAIAGTANTGGGGGGAAWPGQGASAAAGGSGIVIVRYAV
jgi:hypothetical protein